MALSRGGQVGEAGGLSGLEGDLLTSNGPESWGAAGRSGRAVGTQWESVTYLQAMALSRGGSWEKREGCRDSMGICDLLTSNGPESWRAAGRSGRVVGTRG